MKRLFIKTVLASVAVAAMAVAGTAAAQDIKERTIKFGTVGADTHPSVPGMKNFKELVEARSGGKIKVNLFFNGTLGSDQASVTAMQGGTIEMSVMNTGILASVAALESTGLLHEASAALDRHIGDERAVVVVMGLLSAIIDNVPLVAAAQGMYTLSSYPTDHPFWELMAFATGTGGSCLIIGSAAGVAAMGMLRIEFFWYLRRIAPLALAGYLGGALLYLLLSSPWPA